MTGGARWHDYITINVYNLGLSTLSQTLAPLVVPLLVQRFAGEAEKASYYGTVRLWGLMVALLAQALWGMLSDRSTARWGRRRPFILGGTVADLALVACIGLLAASDLAGMTGYWVLFALYVLLQVSFNAGQGPLQALIPDLVPETMVGRFSAVKAVLEVPLPVILVSYTAAVLIGAGNLGGGLLIAGGVLALTMLLTMLVREEPLRVRLPALDWQPFLRLFLMTACFTAIILGLGEGVRRWGDWLQGIGDLAMLLGLAGLGGLLAMLAAISLGVWISVRIGMGAAAQGNPAFTAWVVSRLAFMVGVFNLSSFAVYFLQARLGLVREEAARPAAMLLLYVGVFVLLLALVAGWLVDRYGPKLVIAVAGGVAAFGTLLAILSSSLTLINIGGCFLGAATGLFYTANWALGTRLVPRAEAGRYLGISNLAGAGAGAMGAYIGGPIADYFTARFPDQPGLGYVLLFAIYGVLFLVSAVALIGVRPAEPGTSQAALQATTMSK